MIDSAGGFTVLSFSFVSILVGLVALVLNAGYYCYCFGILRLSLIHISHMVQFLHLV